MIMKRSTVYLNPTLHKKLKIRAAETSRSVSDLVNEAIENQLIEDEQRANDGEVESKQKKKSKLDNMIKREGVLNCDPEELIHMDWSSEWKPDSI